MKCARRTEIKSFMGAHTPCGYAFCHVPSERIGSGHHAQCEAAAHKLYSNGRAVDRNLMNTVQQGESRLATAMVLP